MEQYKNNNKFIKYQLILMLKTKNNNKVLK